MNVAVAWGLVGALLVLRVRGDVPAGELSAIQNTAIRLVMEKFHNQRDLPNGYTMTSVVKAAEEVSDGMYLAGIFVNVQFLIKQTSCHKHDWRNDECQAVKSAKTYNCFGCFKFEYESHSVISHAQECVLPRHLTKGRQARRSDLCKDVEKKDPGTTKVGKYSFLKSD